MVDVRNATDMSNGNNSTSYEFRATCMMGVRRGPSQAPSQSLNGGGGSYHSKISKHWSMIRVVIVIVSMSTVQHNVRVLWRQEFKSSEEKLGSYVVVEVGLFIVD